MTRITACAALCLLAFAAPAFAEPYDHTGGVLLPAGASPKVARQLQSSGVPNGIVADIFRLPATADGKAYTLKTTGGLTGIENPDVYFYQDDNNSIGTECTIDAHEPDPKTENGTICPLAGEKAGWAVVVLVIGAQVTYDFSYA